MLKILRVSVAIVLFTLITAYFLDFREVLPLWVSSVAKLQLVPAILSLSIGIVVFILASTFLFGRYYCSVLCPLGILQDIISWISKKTSRKKKRYRFSPPKTVLRWSALVASVVSFALGFSVLFALIEPYSAFGRIATHILKPIYQAGNNALAGILNNMGNYSLYRTDASVTDLFAFSVALVTLGILGGLAWKYGRTYCNTLCPVGTLLGIVSKYSFFRIRIDATRCNSCGICASKCKASCIDSQSKTVDNNRCVDCFNCLKGCKQQAIHYSMPGKKPSSVDVTDTSRRQFLATGTLALLSTPDLLAQAKKNALGLVHPERQQAIAPPGAGSIDRLRKLCTSCHLCVSKCPSKVIKPALMEYGLGGVMQPMMTYEKGYCNHSCTICCEACPTGALKPLSVEEKKLAQIGIVVFIPDICVVITDGTNCGACSEHCPTQAVKMVAYKDGLTLPEIDTSICIGCGGCEFICPVRPQRAIFVEGNRVHVQAEPFEDEGSKEYEIDDFGF